MKYLAIIPARKGSKRLPDKNILPLLGKPLIVWTINSALQSKYIRKVIVSTDSEEIAQIAVEAGADVPFIRPNHLASDDAKSVDVIEHAINYEKSEDRNYDNIILLQPTSPLRTTKDIDSAIEIFVKKNANSVTSVCEMEHPPLWSNTLPSNLSMENFLRTDIVNKRSQELDTYYRLNGAIYICNIKTFLEENSLISRQKSFAFIMNKTNSVDIDDEIDYKFAEFILNMI